MLKNLLEIRLLKRKFIHFLYAVTAQINISKIIVFHAKGIMKKLQEKKKGK